ncbi:adenylate/guanylate cyclase domain-containing protein [Streptomyces sp. NPDC090077]|uniref:adenylate/guanylate cyclase domain-containing protein n=1 Tax=Streptomyces sp. NPDC090077 TaxID=3365938 RepID=UPI0037FADDF2
MCQSHEFLWGHATLTIDHHGTFSNSSSQVERTILFVDLTGSTALKHHMGYKAWLPILGSFLDIATEAVAANGGTVVKYLGDGALAVFDADRAHDAVCAAIHVQEGLQREIEQGALRDSQATVGIATGKVIEYPAPGGGTMDYVGSAVDLAARFSGNAAPGAIWIDKGTHGAANHNKISSIAGRADHRTDYFQPEETAPAKGFPDDVPYYEVIWDRTVVPRGVKNAVMTETVKARPAAPVPHQMSAAQTGESVDGVVVTWFGDSVRGFKGFISSPDRPDHYVDLRFIAGGEGLKEGAAVRFIPTPAVSTDPGAKPVAGCTVQEGHRIHGTFNNVIVEKRFGFADVHDQRGTMQSLFVYLRTDAAKYSIGQTVLLEIVRNSHGISAVVVDEEAPGSGVDG